MSLQNKLSSRVKARRLARLPRHRNRKTTLELYGKILHTNNEVALHNYYKQPSTYARQSQRLEDHEAGKNKKSRHAEPKSLIHWLKPKKTYSHDGPLS